MTWGLVGGRFWVRLSAEQHVTSDGVGGAREGSSTKKMSRNAHGLVANREEELDIHLLGAAGEYVISLVTGLLWSRSVDAYREADVGPLHVRTRSQTAYELLIRKNDPNGYFTVVTIPGDREGGYTVNGWMTSEEARQHTEWVAKHGGREAAIFVPHRFLHPFPIPEVVLEGWPRTTEMPERYRVLPPFGGIVRREDPVDEGWRCKIEVSRTSPYHAAHIQAVRRDGSVYCGTCHPLVVR